MKKNSVIKNYLLKRNILFIKEVKFAFILFFITCFSLVSLTACREGEAKNDNFNVKPYKATTVEECINEKECVWNAFKQIALDDHFIGEKNKPAKYIPRWKEDIKISFLQTPHEEVLKNVQSDIKRVQQAFPYNIDLSQENSNFLIVILPTFDQENFTKHKNEIVYNFGTPEIDYNLLFNKASQSQHCASLMSRNNGEIKKVVLFVNASFGAEKTCMRMNIYANLEFKHQGLFWLQLSDFQKTIENASTVTNLHLLVMGIFYHPDFPETVNFEIARKFFNKIYPKINKKYPFSGYI